MSAGCPLGVRWVSATFGAFNHMLASLQILVFDGYTDVCRGILLVIVIEH